MRTAEEILSPLGYFVKHNKKCYEYDDVVRIINEARKEAIEECAERAEAWYYYEGDLPEYGVDKESILSLISELK